MVNPSASALNPTRSNERPRGRHGALLAAFLVLAAGTAGLITAPTVEASHSPLVWPTSGTVTTAYHTWRDTCSCYHDAVDIGNSEGTTVVAAFRGTVASTCIGYCGGYGYNVVITHDNGYSTRYAHLSRVDVSQGQSVEQNVRIGLMGNTGHSTGPHLHFEVMKSGVKQYIPGAKGSYVTRGSAIPHHYDLSVNRDPIGNVDNVECTRIRGWAYDPDSPSTSIRVHVYIDGRGYDIGATNVYRSDVNRAYGISGNHGFDWDPPSSWDDGQSHRVEVFAVNAQGGNNPYIGGGSFRCGGGDDGDTSLWVYATRTVCGLSGVCLAMDLDGRIADGVLP